MNVLARAAYALLGAVPASLLSRSRTSPRGAAPLERVFATATAPLRGRTLAVRSGPGAGLLLRGDRRSVVWLTGKVEPEVQSALQTLLYPGATFVDVGASIGFHSLVAARRVGRGGHVVAFEPAPDQASAVRTNAALNGFEHVSVEPLALSSREGTAFLADPGTATASLRSESAAGTLRVPTTTLDAFLADRRPLTPDVVKIDVEGHEADVVRGMRRTLEVHRPTLIVELHGDESILRVLDEHGYTATLLGPALSPDAALRSAHLLATPAAG